MFQIPYTIQILLYMDYSGVCPAGLSLRAVTCNTCYGWVHSMLRVKMSIDGTNMLHLPNLFSNIKAEVLNRIDKYIHLEMNFQFA